MKIDFVIYGKVIGGGTFDKTIKFLYNYNTIKRLGMTGHFY